MLSLPSLHMMSEYSFFNSTIKLVDVFKFAKDNNLKSLAITDRNHMLGVDEFIQLSQEYGIKPIIGIDLDVDDFRLILLSKNFEGYQELMRLTTLKNTNGKITLNDIKTTDIFVIDHPNYGFYKKRNRPLTINNYFIGTTDEDLPNGVYVKDTRVLTESQRETIDLMEKNNNIKSEVFSSYEILTDTQNTSVMQANEIINSIDIVFPVYDDQIPVFKDAKGESFLMLQEIVKRNSIKLSHLKSSKDVYVERINTELRVIKDLGFSDYFLIIWDLVKHARKNKIVIGPGRGSAAGSLVSFLLGITNVDPVKYGLIFERFLNKERKTFPDIDIDIQDDKRQDVINYLFEKYGNDKVAFITTFSYYGAKMSIRDAGKFYNINPSAITEMTKFLRLNETLDEATKQNDAFIAYISKDEKFVKMIKAAKELEGLPRQKSTHPAGIVISNNDIVGKVPLMHDLTGRGQIQYSMKNLKFHGLIKFDLLALKNLTILCKIEKEIKNNLGKKIDFESVNLNDELTLYSLAKGDTKGIFQLESKGMKKTLSLIGVDKFDDLVLAISLYRPGPMDQILEFADRKHGKNTSYKYGIQNLDSILSDTHGIIVYQEQILQIVTSYSGLSLAEADIFRRAISKKNLVVISKQKQQFVEGAVRNNKSQDEAEKIFDLIAKFAMYGFNKSHAVSYSLLAYWLAFLKCHYPFEFYTAQLQNSIGSRSDIETYINEAKKHDIDVVTPNINTSQMKIINGKSKIILTLDIIKGISREDSSKVIEARTKKPFINFVDFISRMIAIDFNSDKITTLIQSGALNDFGNVETLLNWQNFTTKYAKMIMHKTEDGWVADQNMLENWKPVVQDRDIESEIIYEKKLFGFRMNVFETQKYEVSKNKLIDIQVDTSKKIIVYVETINTLKDRNDQEFAFLEVLDSSKKISVVAFSYLWKDIKKMNIEGKLVECIIALTMYNHRKSYKLVKVLKLIK